MRGYVARKGDRWYAVVYEGLDPHPRDPAHQSRRSRQRGIREAGYGNPAFTIDTYQHVLPGMQAEAARIYEKLIAE
ncbi:MAG TPA: hypothetical protein VGA97_10870, partial [Acidimicrobiia bacterium]